MSTRGGSHSLRHLLDAVFVLAMYPIESRIFKCYIYADN
jgi:hypothetical protein